MTKAKPFLIALSVVLGLLGAFSAYKLAMDTFGVPGELHQYYPAATGFYLEAAPGDKLAKRFASYLETQADTLTPPALALTTMERNRSAFRHRFLQQFNATFNPYFSIGVWPTQNAHPAAGLDNGHVLVALPLRQNRTLPELMQHFALPMQDFKQSVTQHIPYLEEKSSGTALAIVNQKLLIANTTATMQATLTHYAKHAPTVFDEPNVKRYLSQLPWLRQGTCILNNSVYGASVPQTAQNMPLSAIGKVFPVMVGGIQAQPNQRLSLRFVAPLVWSGIADHNLRAGVQALFQTTETFPQASQLPPDTALMLGVNSMDKVYDVYQASAMPANQRQWLGMLSLLLNGFHMDWRKDIVGLLEKRTVIATRTGARQSLMLLLDKTPHKDQNLDKLSKLLSTNVFPIQQSMTSVGDLSVQTLSLPTPAQDRISYGTVGTSLVFATPDDFAETVKVANHEQSSLAAQPVYQSVMSGLPSQGNLVLYMRTPKQESPGGSANPNLQKTPPWLEAIGLSLWATPQKQDGATILNGQINLQLASQKP